MSKIIHKAIDLTFVPNSFCNFACSYCYLGRLTDRHENTKDMALQFKKIASKLKDEGIVISHLLLHGAELTASPVEDVKNLLEALSEYKDENAVFIEALSPLRRKSFIHLKTNLYHFDSFYELFNQHKVSISASVDLPLKMQAKYRILKNNRSSLEKVLENVKLLAQYPHGKIISTTMTQEHLNVDEFIADVERLENLGFDMVKDFYIMFSYQSSMARTAFKMPSAEQMLAFYQQLKLKLAGSKYETALDLLWFKEFLGGYCTNCTNCALSQMLIQKNGDVYLCHRSQAVKELKSGNIFEQSYEELVKNGVRNVGMLENSLVLDKECLDCDYFHYCRASCLVERMDTKLGKSYTCALQKQIYKNNPKRFVADKNLAQSAIDEFLKQNQLSRYEEYRLPYISFEMLYRKNNLSSIVQRDEILKQMFDKSNFLVMVNQKLHFCAFEYDGIVNSYKLDECDEFKLLVKEQAFSINCDEPDRNNALRLMLLRDSARIYGDEQRLKNDHILNEELCYTKLEKESQRIKLDGEDFFLYDLIPFLKRNLVHLSQRNFLFFTTIKMREYHYEKHSKNGFYHIQTLNLPFARVYLEKG